MNLNAFLHPKESEIIRVQNTLKFLDDFFWLGFTGIQIHEEDGVVTLTHPERHPQERLHNLNNLVEEFERTLVPGRYSPLDLEIYVEAAKVVSWISQVGEPTVMGGGLTPCVLLHRRKGMEIPLSGFAPHGSQVGDKLFYRSLNGPEIVWIFKPSLPKT